MSIVYDPKKLINKYAPRSKVKKLVSPRLAVKKTALGFVDSVDFIDKKAIENVALKALKNYKDRSDGNPDLKKSLIKDPKLLINRVQNAVLYEINQEIQKQYAGELFEWLPSDAEDPRPLHQLNYGEIFIVGVGDSNGDMPGSEPGCLCGMRILTEDEKLKL